MHGQEIQRSVDGGLGAFDFRLSTSNRMINSVVGSDSASGRPTCGGRKRLDDRLVLQGILFVLHNLGCALICWRRLASLRQEL
jgi:hypothetical protein